MSLSAIKSAIRIWVAGATGLNANNRVIFAHPSAPRPKTSYALINLFSLISLGKAETEQTLNVDKSVSIVYDKLKSASFSINIYYADSFQLASDLIDSIDEEDIQEQLKAAGLFFTSNTAVDDTPEVINKKWEERARFDIVFSTRTADTKGTGTSPDIPSIQKIEITNEIDGYETTIIKGE